MAITPAKRKLRPHIAFLTPSNPIDADSGGKQFTLERLLNLTTLGDVDVFCLQDNPDQNRRLSELLKGRPVFAAGYLKPRTARRWAESVLVGLPLSVWRNNVADLSELISQHSDTAYEAIYVDHWLMWPVSERFNSRSRRFLNLHNAEHMIFKRAADTHRGILRILLRIEAFRVQRYLRHIGIKADVIHSISEADRMELIDIGLPASRITSILPCFDASSGIAGKAGGRVLFSGTLSWTPNAEGLEWFLREVLPDLAIPEPVRVIGGDPLSAWRQLPAAGKVEFLGRVPSVEPFYHDAAVIIAPVFSGSGIKLKIVNALSRGIPVVTTRCGIEGFPAGWEGAVRVCDEPSAFASAIKGVIEDVDGWAAISLRAREYAAKNFSYEAAQSKLKQSLHNIKFLEFFPPIKFAGLTFRGYNFDAIRQASDMPKFVVPVNADLIVRAQEDAEFRDLINQHLATFDGQVPFALARIRNRERIDDIRKLSGSDLIYIYLQEAAQSGKTSFLFGAAPSSNARAVESSQRLYGGKVFGYSPPLVEEPLPAAWTEDALSRIRAVRPAYLFVGLGAPKQERWIASNMQALREAGVEFVMGCGGSIDFLGGTIKRAPEWVQLSCLEGVFRLISEPRLFRLQRIFRSFRIFAHVFK